MAEQPGLASPFTPSADGGFPLSGPSRLPDPATHAYRGDLADVALAGRVVASHYAEPLVRHLVSGGELYAQPDGQLITTLSPGDEFRLLDCTGGWAWGYAPGGLVGYVRGEILGI